jgi:hypothetical protein
MNVTVKCTSGERVEQASSTAGADARGGVDGGLPVLSALAVAARLEAVVAAAVDAATVDVRPQPAAGVASETSSRARTGALVTRPR